MELQRRYKELLQNLQPPYFVHSIRHRINGQLHHPRWRVYLLRRDLCLQLRHQRSFADRAVKYESQSVLGDAESDEQEHPLVRKLQCPRS